MYTKYAQCIQLNLCNACIDRQSVFFSDIVINSAVSVAIVDSETTEIWKFKTFIYKSDKIVS